MVLVVSKKIALVIVVIVVITILITILLFLIPWKILNDLNIMQRMHVMAQTNIQSKLKVVGHCNPSNQKAS